VELPEDDIEQVYASALAAGQPVVPGEYLKDGGYHYYPQLSQVREWADSAGTAFIADSTADGYYSLLLTTLLATTAQHRRSKAGRITNQT